jgi:flagellar basal-body rod protein FlgF
MPNLVSKLKVVLPNPKIAVQKPNVILLSLQKVQEDQLSVSSQNMANALHAGFKGFILSSEECVYKTQNKKKISYVKSSGITRDLSDGALNMTRNPLDLALSGSGYFMVQTENGKRYTRNGRFTLDKDGRLITSTGHAVLNQTGSEIIIPKNIQYFTVSRDGTMFINGSSAGRLGVVEFDDENAMRMEGGSLLSTKEDGKPGVKAIITQGAFEESNVSVMDVSIKLINILHRFEEAQLLIKQYEELQKQTMNASSKNV